MTECTKEGPLSEPITGRVSYIKGHLQREITKHREIAAVEKLGGEMKELMREGNWEQTKPGDLRANAFTQCDAFSGQICLALPNKHYYLSPTDFADSLARYLGVALPSIVEGGLVGLQMPCSYLNGERRGRRRVCDAHGHQMELATLPDNVNVIESTTIEKAIHNTLRYAGIDARWQDRLMFKRGAECRPAIIPDITAKLAYGSGPRLEYLYKVKTVRLSGDTLGYKVRASYSKQHGAMDARASVIPADYLAKARRADAEAAQGAAQPNSAMWAGVAHGDWRNHAADPANQPGLLENRLRARPAPIGLCFGAYGEASQGAHDLTRVVAELLAKERGHELGCAKERQIGIFTQRVRCAWGMAAIRARATSRGARRPLVGCTREQAGVLLAGSCTPALPKRAPGQGELELLDALTWVEDTGARMSREARAVA